MSGLTVDGLQERNGGYCIQSRQCLVCCGACTVRNMQAGVDSARLYRLGQDKDTDTPAREGTRNGFDDVSTGPTIPGH